METTQKLTSSSGRLFICPHCKGKSNISEYFIENMKRKGFKIVNISCIHCSEKSNINISEEPLKYNIYTRPEESILGKRNI